MDDGPPINLENVLAQAASWTFAGDFTLLQWMKQISQDLENRANKTSEALTKLDYNVRSTSIALDNVANRLTTLQFGNQFVECRVQDDDETLANTNKAIIDLQNKPEPTSKEMLNTFLNNNLKVLRNCHEKYSIDLEDSDDEDNSKEKTCIYQAINPYNDRPLPFIFGSKDWHAKWHVGLYENQQENSYSGDEMSEAFSESSSTSHLDDNESFESNTEWASSNSIDNEQLNANIEVKNASSLRGSQPIIYPGTPIAIIAAKSKTTKSESSSTISTSSLTKNFVQTTKQNESLTKKSESVNSISSKNSSKTIPEVSPHYGEKTLQYKTQTHKFLDLFAEPPEDLQSSTSSVHSAQNIKTITDENPTVSEEKPSAIKTQPRSFVDLFAEPPEDVSSILSSGQKITRKTVNLFDEDNDTMNKDSVFSVLTKEEKLEKPRSKENPIIVNKTIPISKTSKSLFDDTDDDDDDFLKAFLKQSSHAETTKSSLAKTLLFDNRIHGSTRDSKLLQTEKDNANSVSDLNTTSNNKHSSNEIQNIYDGYEDELLVNETTNKETKIPIQNRQMDKVSQLVNTSPTAEKVIDKPIVEKDENMFNVPKADDAVSNKTTGKINLFDDFDDLEEENDLFSSKSKNIFQKNSIQPVTGKSNGKSDKNLKDEVATKSIESTQSINDQLKNASNLESNVSLVNERDKNAKEISKKDYTIEQKMFLDTKYTDDTKSIGIDNKHTSEAEIFESPIKEVYTENQKELNNRQNIISPLAQDTTASISSNVFQKSSSSKNYEFNSVLFLDEPPEDDDAFFETLAKTPNTLSSNYNAIDLENDIYEPELPKVPVSSTSNNQVDTSDTFYTGLQLFSDIPPDDDAGGTDIPNNSHNNQTKRVHSVFYDDFNETLLALNQQHTIKEIISDETTAMNENLNSSSKDTTDHEVPDDNEIINTNYRTKSLEKSLNKADNEKTSEFSDRRPVSKLQMPHININVQALLPGASNNLCKTKENTDKSNVVNENSDDVKAAQSISNGSVDENGITISKKHLSEAHRTADTEHILPNVTKNRVKAPATRRPSTRKARQENYRKSLIEQEKILDISDEKNEAKNENNNFQIQKKTITLPTSNMLEKSNNDTDVEKQNLKDIISDNLKGTYTSNVTKTSSTTNLFDDKHKDTPNSFNIAKESPKKSVQNSKQSIRSPLLDENDSNDGVNSFSERKELHKEGEVKSKFNKKDCSFLFSDDDEGDDDFFKQIKTSNISDTNKATEKAKEIFGYNSTKHSLKELEASASNTSVLLASKRNMEMTKDIQVPLSLDADMSTQATKRKEHSNQQSSTVVMASETKTNQVTTSKLKSSLNGEDDDDDLFKIMLQQPTNSSRKLDKNSIAKSQFKSFLDSETDEEPTVARLQSSMHSAAASSKKITNVAISTPKNVNTKLFSDSETDSDDLFGKLSTKNSTNKISTDSTSKSKKKSQTQSIFGDESDSDDFASAPISETTTSKVALKKSVLKSTTQTNTSLFSDLDSEEDDLFGGGSGKVTITNVTNVQNVKTTSTSQPTVSAAKASKSKTVDDNPLADLL